jgi:low affinity Fe/Cu permease
MYEKLGDIALDIVKYVSTGMIIYPLLDGFDKDWRYYILTSVGVVVLAVVGLLLHHIQKKKNNDDNKNK